jgi:hypothetical protein
MAAGRRAAQAIGLACPPSAVIGEPDEGVMVGSPVDLSQAKFVEIKIAGDRVWVNTERGLMFRPTGSARSSCRTSARTTR